MSLQNECPCGSGSTYQLHERSTFEQRAGRWVYVAAVRASTESTGS